MNVSIVNIGDELLIGQVVNTNASVMSQMLTGSGMNVVKVMVVSDSSDAIVDALRITLSMSDAVLLTGGLGPTKDDITKHTLATFFGSELYENEEALENVRRIFEKRGYPLTEVNRRQSWVPRCCTMINNRLGTAPCMWFDTDDGKVVVSLPGVPFEMVDLMESQIVPRLAAHFNCGHILNKNILVQGIGESFLSDLVEPWELALPSSIRLAYLPQAGMLKLRLTARGADLSLLRRQVDDAVSSLYPIAGQYIVGEDAESLPELLVGMMAASGCTLASAESCTGGTIASRITAVPGASAFFKGAVVAYSNEVKERLLSVSPQTLATDGAVSEATVRQMVEGVRNALKADYAVATTGVAGPSGGTPLKPVGMVWMAVSGPRATETKVMQYAGQRQQIVDRASNEIFSMLIKMIKEDRHV